MDTKAVGTLILDKDSTTTRSLRHARDRVMVTARTVVILKMMAVRLSSCVRWISDKYMRAH
jgi:hypothetical protein